MLTHNFFLLSIFLVLFCANSYSQTNIPGITEGDIACADIDGDGNADILIAGKDANEELIFKIFLNDNDLEFTELATTIPGITNGSIDCGDYDHDGDYDILITGLSAQNTPLTKIYKNNGDKTFTEITTSVKPAKFSSAKWGDYDNDLDLDILIAGKDATDNIFTEIYENNGNHTFTIINNTLEPVFSGEVAWFKEDTDDFFDIIVTGNNKAVIYKNNNADGTFTDLSAGLTGVSNSTVDINDFDNDNDNDLLITTDYKLYHYENNEGTYDLIVSNTGDTETYKKDKKFAAKFYNRSQDDKLNIITTGEQIRDFYNNENTYWVTHDVPGLSNPLMKTCDMNNDGLWDLIMTGENFNSEKCFKIYYNYTENIYLFSSAFKYPEEFSKVSENISTLRYSTSDWGDYNKDGRQDLNITGEKITRDIINQIYTNSSENSWHYRI